MTASRVHSRSDFPMAQTRSARAILFLILPGWIGILRERARISRDLRKLAMADDHILRDLGISRADVERMSGHFRD